MSLLHKIMNKLGRYRLIPDRRTGDDWAKKDYYTQMQFTQDWLDENDIVLVYLAYTRGISTTEIKKRIINGTI